MITPYDVPASKLIEKLATYLKENVDAVTPPSWASVAKTGPQAQRQPENPDWWYVRCASLLRKIYVHSLIGTEKLRADYGGRKDFSGKREHAVKAGGAIIRKALQQLEAAGLIETLKPRGRRITKNGRKLLQELAGDIQKGLAKEVSQLEKHQKSE